MGKRVLFVALLGWGFILGLAWKLADKRIDLCGSSLVIDRKCMIAAAETRDNLLAAGLTVALIAVCLSLLVSARRARTSPGGWRATANPVEAKRLR